MRLIIDPLSNDRATQSYETMGPNRGGPYVSELSKFYAKEGKAVVWHLPGKTIELQLSPVEVETLIKELTAR